MLKIIADISGLPTHQVTWKDPLGATAACPGCSTSYEYSANGGIISSTSEFSISGQLRPSGTYTAIVTYCTFNVGNTCLGWGEMFRANFTISDVTVTYTIAGNAGIAGADLSYIDATAKTVVADGAGDYSISVPQGWSGTVTPSKAGYIFLPASKSYTNVQVNQTAQNYSASTLNNWIFLPLAIR